MLYHLLKRLFTKRSLLLNAYTPDYSLDSKTLTMTNLQYIADNLPKLAKEFPHIVDEFNMDVYGCYFNLTKETLSECATYGCLLGNAAMLFNLDNAKFYDSYFRFSYTYFSHCIFPYIHISSIDGWNFLFGSIWDEFQPSFNEAIDRIKYYIEMDGEIQGWKYQKESFKSN